jgi:hypothetical protein
MDQPLTLGNGRWTTILIANTGMEGAAATCLNYPSSGPSWYYFLSCPRLSV